MLKYFRKISEVLIESVCSHTAGSCDSLGNDENADLKNEKLRVVRFLDLIFGYVSITAINISDQSGDIKLWLKYITESADVVERHKRINIRRRLTNGVLYSTMYYIERGVIPWHFPLD